MAYLANRRTTLSQRVDATDTCPDPHVSRADVGSAPAAEAEVDYLNCRPETVNIRQVDVCGENQMTGLLPLKYR